MLCRGYVTVWRPPVLEACRPRVGWRGGVDPHEDAGPVCAVAARHMTPVAAVVVQSERLVLLAVDVVARGPDVITANGRDAGENVIARAHVRHGGPCRPPRAVVVQEQGSESIPAVPPSDRPNVVGAGCSHTEQGVAQGARVGARDELPRGTIPPLYEALVRVRGAGGTDRPRVVGAQGVHARQRVVSTGAGVRARYHLPSGPGPTLDERDLAPGARGRVANRPDVFTPRGVHPVQRVRLASDIRNWNLGPATAIPMLGTRPYGVRIVFRAAHNPNVVAGDGSDRRWFVEVLAACHRAPGRLTYEAVRARSDHQQHEARRQEPR